MEDLKPMGSDKVLRALRGDKRAGRALSRISECSSKAAPRPFRDRGRPQLGLPVPTDRYMLDGRPDALGKLGRSMMAEVEEKGR